MKNPIFLHFLNREAYRTVGASHSLLDLAGYVGILFAATGVPLYTNFSNLFESGILASRYGDFLRFGLDRRQLLIIGERSSADEFVESRAVRYYFDRERYPMYFDKRVQVGFDLEICQRASSATDFIAANVSKIAEHKASLSEVGLTSTDQELLSTAIPSVSRRISSRSGEAITLSLLSPVLPELQNQRAAARLISALYVTQHLDEHGSDIATGALHLNSLDSLSRGTLGSCDLVVFDLLLRACGLSVRAAVEQDPKLLYPLLTGRLTEAHSSFSRRLQNLIAAIVVARRCGKLSILRQHALSVLRRAEGTRNLLDGKRSKPYEEATAALEVLIQGLIRPTWPAIYTELERIEMMESEGANVLIVTATKVETQALVAAMKTRSSSYIQRYVNGDAVLLSRHGVIGQCSVYSVQCEAGSSGTSGSQAVITDAIGILRPRSVIVGGICFGCKKEQQSLGDILISKFVVEYEKAKKANGYDIARGGKHECPSKILAIMRAAEVQYSGDRQVNVGTLLSGEKLIDSQEFLDKLLKLEPEAIGGEMEGAGLMGSAARSKTDWIVVKGIVDWASGKSQNNAEDHQFNVARGVFDFILDAVELM